MLRAASFPRTVAHGTPVRPESYISMDNFYTATVYKGAEIVRMYSTILGEAGFKKGMKLYFERHDGGSHGDDFRAALLMPTAQTCLSSRDGTPRPAPPP